MRQVIPLAAALKDSLTCYRKDPWIWVFSLAPVVLGLALWGVLGTLLYSTALSWAEARVASLLGPQESLGAFVHYVLLAIFTVGLFFFFNALFILSVSFVSAPFNDLIGQRAENLLLGQVCPLGTTFHNTLAQIRFILANEAKKILFILGLSAISFFFFPPLSALLVGISLIDYSWARHTYSFSQCLKDFRARFGPYASWGIIFSFLLNIPLVNLLALPFGVVLFTALFCRGRVVAKDTVG